MTEPSAARPVAGPARPVPGPAAPHADQDRFGDLEGRPVTEHVDVFEAEHDRLQSALGTIDRV